MNITVAGIGRLGSCVAYTCMIILEPVDLIRLYDTKDLTGDLLDLEHARNGLGKSTKFTLEPIQSDITIISAGFSRSPTMRSWRRIIPYNKIIVKDVLADLNLPCGSKIFMLTNPVDVIVKWAKQRWTKYNFYDIETELNDLRPGRDNGWQIVKHGKGYTNFGASVATVMKISRLIDRNNYRDAYAR